MRRAAMYVGQSRYAARLLSMRCFSRRQLSVSGRRGWWLKVTVTDTRIQSHFQAQQTRCAANACESREATLIFAELTGFKGALPVSCLAFLCQDLPWSGPRSSGPCAKI